MGVGRWLLAVGLAVAMVLLLASGVWWWAGVLAERTLVAQVQQHLGGALSYDTPVRSLTLRHVQLTLPNTVVSSPVLNAGHQLHVQLPPQWQLEATGAEPHSLTITAPSATLTLGGRGSPFVHLQATEATVADASGTPVLLGEGLTAAWRNGSVSRSVQVGAARLVGVGRTPITNMKLELEPYNMHGLAPAAWQVLLGRDVQALKDFLYLVIRRAQTGGSLKMPVVALQQNGVNAMFFGNLDVNGRGTPEGELTLNATNAHAIKEWLAASRLFTSVSVEENFRAQRALTDLTDAHPQASLIFHQGAVIMNTQRVGRASSATAVVDALVKE
jgi:hypothetical protein